MCRAGCLDESAVCSTVPSSMVNLKPTRPFDGCPSRVPHVAARRHARAQECPACSRLECYVGRSARQAIKQEWLLLSFDSVKTRVDRAKGPIDDLDARNWWLRLVHRGNPSLVP